VVAETGKQPSAPLPHAEPRPRWMRWLFAVAVMVGLFNIGAFLYGLTLPNEWHVEASHVIAAPPEAIYPSLAAPQRWTTWIRWIPDGDPTLQTATEGPESGVGASLTWSSEQLGQGQLTILETEPDRFVRYQLDLQGETFSTNGKIQLFPVEEGTRVLWSDGGRLGNTLSRLFRERLERSLADEFAASLRRLESDVLRRSRDLESGS
jgi:uncharacterized protein YndB with AHSA1/START domain